MSATKTATAALMGVAHAMKLITLDTKLSSYGLNDTLANWSHNKDGINYFPDATVRDLLSQTTGIGNVYVTCNALC